VVGLELETGLECWRVGELAYVPCGRGSMVFVGVCPVFGCAGKERFVRCWVGVEGLGLGVSLWRLWLRVVC
jgi:hypothetical protein